MWDKTRTLEASRLADEIGTAFVHEVYPGDNRLIECPGGIEENALANNYRGKQWKELDAQFLINNDALYFFTAAAFIFYLPAFLRASLDYYSASPLVHSLIRVFRDMADARAGKGASRFLDICARLTVQQAEVCKRVLEHMSRYYAIELSDREKKYVNTMIHMFANWD